MTTLEIVEQGTILRATVGSTVHGLHDGGQDDRDEMAVFVEPPEYLIGLRLAVLPEMQRGCGGTGRRTGLRSRRPRGHEGSTPSVRTSLSTDRSKEARAMTSKRHDVECSF